MDNATGGAVCPNAADLIARMCSDHTPVTTDARFSVGMVFGDWRLTAFIGRGGNGEVYCAEHGTLGTPAAVKVLIRDDERARIRFEREAKLLAKLKSAAFPRFFAYGEVNPPPQSGGAINGTAYLAMELLEPGELPTGDRAVASFLLKVCEAVGELHALGYLHRDIKPSNILWRMAGSDVPPIPVLADLGLVKEIPNRPTTEPLNHQTAKPPNSQTTLAGVGTPGYGAPEQMERGEVTEASDIHALGVLADQCFNGKPPRPWKRIIERATSSLPAHRYQSVSALADAIRRRNLRRMIGSFTAVAIAMGGLAASLFIWWKRGGDEVWKWNSLCKRGVIESVTTRYEPLDERHPKYPARIVRHVTNSTEGVILHLSRKTISFARPIRLKPGEYRIVGPGRLDADISGSSNVVVRLKNCVFNNMTRLPYPRNGIRYELEGGAYLNFANQKNAYRGHKFIHSDSDAPNEVRFRGPLTVKELNEERNREFEKILLESRK